MQRSRQSVVSSITLCIGILKRLCWGPWSLYKMLAPVEEIVMEFFITGDSDYYNDLDIKLYVRRKLVSSSGKFVDMTDTNAVTNNLLHSLFFQCTVILNVVPVKQSHEHYNNRAYFENLLTYSTDV